MSKSRIDLLVEVAGVIADYRQGEIASRTPDVVDQWVKQFPANWQEPILDAIANTLKQSYVSRSKFKIFLSSLATTDKLSPGTAPPVYWRSVNFLNIQQGGNSQRDILAMFNEVLQETHGFSLLDTGSNGGDFIYLDDCVATGTRVRNDVCAWVESTAPQHIRLHIISPALYRGAYWVDDRIKEAARNSGKAITIEKWRLDRFDLENRRNYRNTSDVLWPTALPDDAHTQAYAAQLVASGHPAILRTSGNSGAHGLYASDAQKILLEHAFLMRGCQIRSECGNLPERARPLGYHNFDCLGFGSMVITYRNCPNNTPLVFWVQQGQYPALFPRKTNTQVKDEQFFKGFFS